MKVIETALAGVLIIEPKVFGDSRGFFLETFHSKRYEENGIAKNLKFVQDNHSRSSKGVLRGLHYQINKPQGKLVMVVTGSVFDVVADINPDSPTFSKWVGVELSEENHRQLWVPPGYAHGFCVLSDTADFVYKCTDMYNPSDEAGIIWNDPDLEIEWPLEHPLVSKKDAILPQLSNADKKTLPK
ncbi:MAG: dTDP-4-dehydrorhamnose 3,5-epimerase [Mariprofundales bacterium]